MYLESLSTICAAGTAESEGQFLEDVFISPAIYAEIIAPPTGSPYLLLGRKGSGKTALLKVLRKKCQLESIPVLFLRPEDLELSFGSSDNSTASLKRACYEALVRAIASHIGSRVNVALTDADKALLSQARKDGSRDTDAIEKVLQVLVPLGKAVADIDFEAFAPKSSVVPSATLQRALKEKLGGSGSIFYFLLDDTDQVASPDADTHLNRIWALILAIRKLTEEVPNVKAIISLRSEVWTRMHLTGAGQRDQLDHFRNLRHYLNSDDESMRLILERRLRVAATRSGVTIEPADIYDLFFASYYVILPTIFSEEARSWKDFLVKSSRERPRDVVQLLKTLADKALTLEHPKVSSATVEKALPVYSKERVDDLMIEFERDCPYVDRLIRGLVRLPYRSDSDCVKKFLRGLPSGIPGLKVRGTVIQPGNIEHAFRVWAFLHEAGVLNPRIHDVRKEKCYRHINYLDHPDFVSESNWNDMQKVEWEIHPAYRSYLEKIQTDEDARQRGRVKSRKEEQEKPRRGRR